MGKGHSHGPHSHTHDLPTLTSKLGKSTVKTEAPAPLVELPVAPVDPVIRDPEVVAQFILEPAERARLETLQNTRDDQLIEIGKVTLQALQFFANSSSAVQKTEQNLSQQMLDTVNARGLFSEDTVWNFDPKLGVATAKKKK
jgi:hypothetical protein